MNILENMSWLAMFTVWMYQGLFNQTHLRWGEKKHVQEEREGQRALGDLRRRRRKGEGDGEEEGRGPDQSRGSEGLGSRPTASLLAGSTHNGIE